MKTTSALLITAALLLLGPVLPLAAQVPQIINYQGRIAVGSTPFTGTGQFRFALVNGAGTTSYWSNDGTSTAGSEPTAAVSLPVVNGLYLVPLGDSTLTNMTAIPNAVFSNADVRVRVWFNDGTTGSQQLSPDQRITSVGYAMMAGQAQTVPDGSITTAKLAPGITIHGNVTGNASTSTQGTALIGTLQSPGTINQAFNPVDWTQLKGVPPGFADGTDAVGVTSITAGSGLIGGTITGSGTIALSADVPLRSNSFNQFFGDIMASNFIGNGSNLYNLHGGGLLSGSVPLSALSSNARPKYDRQMVVGNPTVSSYGGSFVDVPGMTLTTKDLGENGTYIVSFSGSEQFSNSVSNASLPMFALVVGGVRDSNTESYGSPTVSGSQPSWKPVSFTVRLASVPSGTVIKLQVRNSQGGFGQLFIDKGKLTIDGVPSSQVVP